MKLLFICTHNRCRSILAEAIANHIGDGHIQAFSAGSAPQQQVHPLSLHFLREAGIDTQGLQSQSWHTFEQLQPDAIITLCDTAAKESCPMWFDSTVQIHWGLRDPSSAEFNDDQRQAMFAVTIRTLKKRIETLLENNGTHLRGDDLHKKLNDLALQIA